VSALYNVSQQSLPAGPLISAFVPSQQTAISQLANAYCGQLLGTQQYRDAFFGTGLDGSLTAGASSFFGASGSPQRAIVINALVMNAVGNATPAAANAVRAEVDALLTRIPTITSTTVSAATVAACTAVLGSAAVTLQ